ncbi:MAG: glycosyltransferase [Flavobacteriales bacterium]|nr:glycosyltransferase [Flavobacteriales bacterium]MDW8432388.1 glycosyltransferase [Flavobacteriales bacterium]
MEKPLVTVLMPVFNAREFVAEALESILRQTYSNLEVIVIDDGSQDGSVNILKSFSDSRLKLFLHENNKGLIATLNEGLEMAQGDYIARMDADDVAFPERLEVQVGYMRDNPNVGILGSWVERFGASKGQVKYPLDDAEIRWELTYRCSFCHPSVMVRRKVLKSHDLRYDQRFPHAEDYEFWTRLMDYTRGANLPRPLLRYRVHSGNISQTQADIQRHNTERVIQERFKVWGYEAGLEEVRLFRRFADRSFEFSPDEVHALLPLWMHLLSAPQFPDYSKRQVAQRIQHLLLQSVQLSYQDKALILRRLSQETCMQPGLFWKFRIFLRHFLRNAR